MHVVHNSTGPYGAYWIMYTKNGKGEVATLNMAPNLYYKNTHLFIIFKNKNIEKHGTNECFHICPNVIFDISW